jgi:uncharacterized membrane protein
MASKDVKLNGFIEFMSTVSRAFEILGVGVIVVGFGVALVRAVPLVLRKKNAAAYELIRATFGRAVLLGLEILVAADIIRTVTMAPTLSNLAALGLLVAIRTFLSWSLEVEIDGRWPWQRHKVP